MTRQQVEKLIYMAGEARKNARVPMSGFRVGAALLSVCGDIITGCNVELSNMYESICAERCALVKAISMGYSVFTAIAVVSDALYPISPCGFCRHTLIDYGKDIDVIMSNEDMSQIVIMTSAELLPGYNLELSPASQPIDKLFD